MLIAAAGMRPFSFVIGALIHLPSPARRGQMGASPVGGFESTGSVPDMKLEAGGRETVKRSRARASPAVHFRSCRVEDARWGPSHETRRAFGQGNVGSS